jgi:anaerobic selenocysteine-containing dehydrogenase
MSDQFFEGGWSGGSKFYWQADTGNAEFILFVGSSPYEANYGPPLRGQKVTQGLVDGRLKIAVIDPRCSKTAAAKSLKAWAEAAGVKESDIAELAQEFTSHGKRAVADIHRGVSQHTSGFYKVLAWMLVNVLIGNHDWMGGLAKATGFEITGSIKGKPFDTNKHDGRLSPWGVSIIRHEATYDKTTLFSGFPAKRVWYPFSSDIYQEVIPSMGGRIPLSDQGPASLHGVPCVCASSRQSAGRDSL